MSVETHQKLRRLADELRVPISDVLSDAVEHYRRQVFWKEFDAAVRRLRADPEAWTEVQAERTLWDSTLKDGLEPEEWTEADFTPPVDG